MHNKIEKQKYKITKSKAKRNSKESKHNNYYINLNIHMYIIYLYIFSKKAKNIKLNEAKFLQKICNYKRSTVSKQNCNL